MVAALKLAAGGGDAVRPGDARQQPRAAFAPAIRLRAGEPFLVPGARGKPTLAEIFAASPGDAGWAGFLLPQLSLEKPWLWIQERMAILESGRIHPAGLPSHPLIHVETRDARDLLWAMEEGLRCTGIGAVIGELWGDPAALDFTATRRLAVAAERHGVAALLIRLGGHANLSGARQRWRIASAPSLAHPYNPQAPGEAAWECDLFRQRGGPPGRWSLTYDALADRTTGGFRLVADARHRPLGEAFLRRA